MKRSRKLAQCVALWEALAQCRSFSSVMTESGDGAPFSSMPPFSACCGGPDVSRAGRAGSPRALCKYLSNLSFDAYTDTLLGRGALLPSTWRALSDAASAARFSNTSAASLNAVLSCSSTLPSRTVRIASLSSARPSSDSASS
eukprot:2732409-Prymnesium_polylepis.1